MKEIWGRSNANDPSIPIDSRNEDGGWLVDNGDGSVSFVPFPATWPRTPCGIDPPSDWATTVPAGAFSIIHSHPFYEGEDTRPVCTKEADASYTSGPSEWDKFFLLAHETLTGYHGFIGYVIDGSNITIYDRKYSGQKSKYSRCGY